MQNGYDLVIVGMGSGGMTAAEFGAGLGLRVAVVERARVGGDCLWTGCVPSKALLASAKAAHTIRNAEHYGLPSVSIDIDTGAVWDRLRRIQDDIASTDDDPARYAAMGVEIVRGAAQLVGPNEVVVDGDRRLRSSLHLVVHGEPATRASDTRPRRRWIPHVGKHLRARACAAVDRVHRRRPDRDRDGAGAPAPRRSGHRSPAG